MHPGLFLLACTCLLSSWVAPASAGTAQASLAVNINLQDADSALCRSASSIGIFGAAITVFCTTGAWANYSGNIPRLPQISMRDNTYRFVTQVSRGAEPLETVDSYTGGGAVTSWRVIRLSKREYLEMTVHW
jgi:hypothetical protein